MVTSKSGALSIILLAGVFSWHISHWQTTVGDGWYVLAVVVFLTAFVCVDHYR